MKVQTERAALTIDGRTVEYVPGTTVLEAAAAAGIDIPNLCAHPSLKPFGRCRLCLVEIEGVRGYPSACTTPTAAGMVVVTESPALAELRRGALELILTEHPTGCLLCGHQDACLEHHGCHARRSGTVTGCRFCPNDQQCELQDMVERLGVHDMEMAVRYRGLKVDRRDPFLDRDYNLCILCARCVRVCDEVRGAQAVALTFRGPKAMVGTAYDRPLTETECQFCGECVDLCPTGALAERVNKWVGVPDGAVTTTCPLCSLGCQLELRTLDGQVVGARPADGSHLCAKGRFAPVELSLPENRVLEPMVRRHGRLTPVSWEEALAAAATGLAAASRVGVFASRDLLSEDLAAVAELARKTLGTAHLETDATAARGAAWAATADLHDLESAGLIVTVRADLRYSHTPVQLAIRQAVTAGARLVTVEPYPTDLQRLAALKVPAAPGDEAAALATLVELVREEPAAVDSEAPREGWHLEAYELFRQGGPAVIVWGGVVAQSSGGAETLRALADLADTLGAGMLPLVDGGNTRGAETLGIAPGPEAHALNEWLDGRAGLEAMVSFGRQPGAGRPPVAFWVAHTPWLDEALDEADVVFPATVFSEQNGTLMDVFGRRHKVRAAVAPAGEARGAAELCAALTAALAAAKPAERPAAELWPESNGHRPVEAPRRLTRELLLDREYSRFSYLGHSLAAVVPGLIPLAREGAVQIHPADALKLGLRDGETLRLETATGFLEAVCYVNGSVSPGAARLVVAPADEPGHGFSPFELVLGPNPGSVTARPAPAGRG